MPTQHEGHNTLIEQDTNVRCRMQNTGWVLFHCSLVRHLAMVLRALTAVSWVVSFFRWSRKIGRHMEDSGLRSGPKWLKMCPLARAQKCSV